MEDSASKKLIIRQLFDQNTWTYTYLLADTATKKAVIIDPVYEKVERDMKLINEMGLTLVYAINTHVHADHITGSGYIKRINNAVKSVISEVSGAKADVLIKEGDKIEFGNQTLECYSTPGHTDGCMTYVSRTGRAVFTGDALLIRGCGRTDFQQGNSNTLYDSIHQKIFTLPDDFIVYPGHDYNGHHSSTVGEEKKHNPRLTQTREKFIEIMANLNLPHPRHIAKAVPANMICGMHDISPIENS